MNARHDNAAMTSATLPWLIRHELRLWARDGERAGRVGRIIALLILTLLPIGFGIRIALDQRHAPAMPAAAIGPLATGFAGLVLLMLSGACIYVLRSFHERRDLDLLLAAPVPPARIMAAKSLAIHASVALPLLFVATPFAVASALLGHPGWLGGLAVIIIAAVIATSFAFVIVASLFSRIGARRGRIIVQIGGGVFAVSAALLAQTPNIAPDLFRRISRWLAQPPPPPLDAPARAALGDPVWLLALTAVALLAATVAARITANRLFAAGPPSAGDRATTAPLPGSSRPRTNTGRFRRGLARILLIKELQLLGRDAELLSSVALQLAYMIPAFALIFSGSGASPTRLAAACVLFCGLLTASLAWLTICGEDAPDLIAAAPLPPGLARRMKILAACLPPLAMVLLPLLVTAATDGRAGLVALLLCPVAAATAATQQGWAGRPQPRRAFRARQKSSLLLAVAEYSMAGAWAGTAALLVQRSPYAALTAGLALAILAGSRVMFRQR